MNAVNDMEQMVTNDSNRNTADRNIPLTKIDILYEFLGNQSGDIRAVYIDYDNNRIYLWNNDDGFSNIDEIAYLRKNQSGNRSNTASINGIGEALAIDRCIELSSNKRASIYSLSTNRMVDIGNFKVSKGGWKEMAESDMKYCKNIISTMGPFGSSVKHGTFKIIPIKDEYVDKFKNENEKYKNACLKFLNLKINNGVDFFWNGKKETINQICEDNKTCIHIEYELGYDTEPNTIVKHKASLIMKITNLDTIQEPTHTKLNEYMHISPNKKPTEYNKFQKQFIKFESGYLRLNISPTDHELYKVNVIDGAHVYLNGLCINYNALNSRLGGRTENGVYGRDIYNGKPRFENHINNKTNQYKLPPDKTNIQCDTNGKSVHSFIRYIMKPEPIQPISSASSSPTIPMETSDTTDRKNFSEINKNKTLLEQDFKCINLGNPELSKNNCGISNIDLNNIIGYYKCPLYRNGGGGKFTTTKLKGVQYICEYDHIIEVRHKGDNSLENCQALCRECHYIKTLINTNK